VEILRPGEGPELCIWVRQSQRCTHHEVFGLEYCMWHMPDDLLEEAESVTGWHRCRRNFGEPNACHQAAVKGTDPPRCKNCGANRGSVLSNRAAANVVSSRGADRLVAILSEHGEKLISPDPIGDPLSELLDLAAEVKAFKELMRHITAYLITVGENKIRYQTRYGEELRAEILLYERAAERLGKLLVDISKLGIEARLAQISATQVQLVERALDAAMGKVTDGLPDALERAEQGRVALRRELMRVASLDEAICCLPARATCGIHRERLRQPA
jgi:hypothetical protein